jgi:multidrug efflux pump
MKRVALPRDVEDPVVSNRTGGDALMYLALLSDEMSVQQRADYAARFIQPVLSTVEVWRSAVLGSGNFAMRIWLNPTKMAAFGVTAMDADDAIRRDNYISAAGHHAR